MNRRNFFSLFLAPFVARLFPKKNLEPNLYYVPVFNSDNRASTVIESGSESNGDIDTVWVTSYYSL